jgi:hypothetical protein
MRRSVSERQSILVIGDFGDAELELMIASSPSRFIYGWPLTHDLITSSAAPVWAINFWLIQISGAPASNPASNARKLFVALAVELGAVLLEEGANMESAETRVMKSIPIGQLRPSAYQPRKVFDDTEIERLTNSIKSRDAMTMASIFQITK